jgi:transposase
MTWRRGQAYGQDLRDRVLASSGASLREVAERLSVSPSYVSKVWARLRETGERAARPQRNQVPLRLVPMLSALRTRTGATPDATLAELRAWAEAEHGVRGHPSGHVEGAHPARADAQKRLRAAEQDRPDVAEARRNWAKAAPGLEPDRMVFIDETWATTNMTRTHGRAPRGVRLVAAVPHGHWHTTTFLCGLRTTGMVAPLVLEGAINGRAFRAYIEQMLAPTLAPGDIVVMDNLGSHKVSACAKPSRRRERACSTCRPTAPT